MDRLMNRLVRLMAFLARFASPLSRLGLVKYRRWDGSEKRRILLVGYNGARNTGADVRVAAMVEQLERALGKDNIQISVMTLDVENVRCYFAPHIKLVPFSSIFFWDVFRACSAHHMVILCEGSTLQSTFANALTLFFCEAAGIMKSQKKPCIAYGSEAGDMPSFLERTVKKLCSDTYFIARTQGSLDQIRRLGLSGCLGTDTAWSFASEPKTEWAQQHLRETGWDGESPLLGIAVINPFWWPVQSSLIKLVRAVFTGDWSMQFQKWYFFRWSKQRAARLEAYLNAIAEVANRACAGKRRHIVLLGMERLDADACARLQAKLMQPASVFLAKDCNGYEMAAVLRSLSALITSRYHAQVLSMAGLVPSIALTMDDRLSNLMTELGMEERQLLRADDAQLAQKLARALEYVDAHRPEIQDRIRECLPHYLNALDDMARVLVWWLSQTDARERKATRKKRVGKPVKEAV